MASKRGRAFGGAKEYIYMWDRDYYSKYVPKEGVKQYNAKGEKGKGASRTKMYRKKSQNVSFLGGGRGRGRSSGRADGCLREVIHTYYLSILVLHIFI